LGLLALTTRRLTVPGCAVVAAAAFAVDAAAVAELSAAVDLPGRTVVPATRDCRASPGQHVIQPHCSSSSSSNIILLLDLDSAHSMPLRAMPSHEL
jgi:hypothetical protein